MKKALLMVLSAALVTAGCSLIPPYERPQAPVAGDWPQGRAYTANAAARTAARPAQAAAAIGWRDFFHAPQMQALIARALKNNRDLRVAVLSVEQARAAYRVQRADRLPTVNAGASAARKRVPADVARSSKAVTSTQYDVNLGITAFELDLFGRVASLEQQALDQYLATEEAQRGVQIALIAEVANAYLTLQADQEQVRVTEDTLATQQDAYNLTKASYDRGVATKLALRQAQTSVETARVNHAVYIRQAAQDRNALELLVGAPLQDKEVAAAAMEGLDDFIADLPAGLPSDLLLNRPDIREAELLLKAANANIGAARAAFYPRISLTTAAGLESLSLSNLFKSGAGTWTFAPSLTMPIFEAGRNQANLDVARAQRAITVAQYEKAIQTAFREVADALAVRGTIDDQLKAQQALVDATEESYSLSRQRYDRGVDNYLTVLDSERSLYSARQGLINTQLARLGNLVNLYKVLGGGVVERTQVSVGQ